MKIWSRLAGLLMMLAAVAPSLVAQWPSYPSKSVPRTADGEVDLLAPTPRTADGKPDFSGIWQNGRGGGGAGPARGAAGAGGQRGAAAPRGAGAPAQPAGIPVASFANVGSGFPDGLPLKPWASELVRKRMADSSKDNPDAHCLPMGFMQFHTHPQPRKIVQTAEMVLIIYEANSGLRQIFKDGRSLPDKTVEPWWYGYSAAKWEGDTLVVETTGFLDRDPETDSTNFFPQWLDIRGNPLTDQAKVTERFRRPNFGTIEIDITIDDPKAYTKPFTVRVNWRLMPDTELIEFICEERDATHYVGASGVPAGGVTK